MWIDSIVYTRIRKCVESKDFSPLCSGVLGGIHLHSKLVRPLCTSDVDIGTLSTTKISKSNCFLQFLYIYCTVDDWAW